MRRGILRPRMATTTGKRGRGRPGATDAVTGGALAERHQIRFTSEEWKVYEEKAAELGRQLGVPIDAGTWVRMQARKAAGLAG